MPYKLELKDKKYHLKDITTDKVLTIVNYESIFSSDAKFEIDGDYYTIKANNIWQTKFDILKNNKDLGDIDYNWKGEIILRLQNNDNLTKHFLFKMESAWKSIFCIYDFLTNQIYRFEPVFNWKKFKYDIYITEGSNQHDHENDMNDILLMLMGFYALNLYLKTSASGTN